ncbi:MAG: hypothetical protein JWR17_365 [Pseudomonas sp.]|jgi:hypothetical protein|nr:hypothetical protein [Pseudomonas sp.]
MSPTPRCRAANRECASPGCWRHQMLLTALINQQNRKASISTKPIDIHPQRTHGKSLMRDTEFPSRAACKIKG